MIVSQAPVVSGSSAPVSPLFVRRAVAAFPPALLDLARSFLRPGGIASLAWRARLFLDLESGFCCALQLQV